ncbi:hypothetical protein RZS08_55265, partial [Arthrospira platensis SPKY1]|nr:hypothetical protein [Arthrospira platensis SPKY1]
ASHDLLEELLIPLFNRHTPRQIIAVWDSGNTYRLSISGKYKARRLTEEKDPALKEQMKALFDAVRELLAGVGVKQVRVPGEEADDVIAHLVERLPGTKMIHT